VADAVGAKHMGVPAETSTVRRHVGGLLSRESWTAHCQVGVPRCSTGTSNCREETCIWPSPT